MQCAQCGRPLRPHETLCPFCGEPVVADATVPVGQGTPADAPESSGQRQVVHPSGTPVDAFAPTLYGPPIGPERFARVAAVLDTPARHRIQGYRVVTPAFAPSRPRRPGWLRGLAVVVSVAALVVLAGGALAATGHRLPGLEPLLGQGAAPTATATVRPSPTPACAAPAINPQAAPALDDVVLTTGVSGAALKPVDHVSTFVTGQTVHVVFHIRAAGGGSVDATFCTDGALSTTTHPLVVPAGYAARLGQNARGQFFLTLDSSSAGSGLVSLTWNGQVAAVVPFTVMHPRATPK